MNGGMKMKILFLALFAIILSCAPREDIAARYRLEELAWRARMIDRQMAIDFLRSSEREIELITGAYEAVVAGDPLPDADARSWDPAVVRDIKMLVMGSKITLTHLYFLGERYFQSGIHFREIIDDPVVLATGSGKRKLELARMLYGIPSGSGRESQCERYFREIVTSDDFWIAPLAIRESFLEIPIVLARIHKVGNDQRAFESISELAESFYTKVIRVWPDSLIAEQARLQNIHLLLVREDWKRALGNIDEMMAHANRRGIAPRLMLLKGRIAEAGALRPNLVLELYATLAREYPGSPEAYAGDVSRAMILTRLGRRTEANQLLREVEKNENAPDDIRSLAMLVRAIHLRSGNSWNEAILILRRLQNQFPFTEAALESPLVITSYYVETGDSTLAIRNLERAKKFYLSLMERKNTLFEQGLLPEDYLIENYLIAGRSEEIAGILIEESRRWGWSSNAGALLKSAHLYANSIGDRQRSEEILKKCLALFHETRYSGVAGNSLSRLGSN